MGLIFRGKACVTLMIYPSLQRPPSLRVVPETFAPVEIGLAPDPRLVIATHFRFHGMDTAEIPVFCYSLQERADRDIFPGIGIAQFDGYDIPEISGPDIGTGNPRTIFHGCEIPPQDISPLLPHPGIQIGNRWRDTGAEDPAAEPALLAGFVSSDKFVHGIV